MVIRIKHARRRLYDSDGDELVGYCSMPTPHSMNIEIAKRHNRNINDYAGTVLHELLHGWINMLTLRGFVTDEDTEEEFTRLAEEITIAAFKKLFGRKHYGASVRAGSKQRSARVHR